MTMIPGVRPAEGFDPTKTRVGNISINGGDGRQLGISVDGGDNKDLVVGGLVLNIPVFQEFNVVTDQYTAEAGHSVGGVANVIGSWLPLLFKGPKSKESVLNHGTAKREGIVVTRVLDPFGGSAVIAVEAF
jgi:hypothetical protein